jgi:uncharacterized protein YdeI (YjbR/CyaY-like superfamily)
MEIGETLQLNSRQEWRDWLSDHHRDQGEIWLVLYKSTSGKRPITLREAMDEALCFGWIDSTLKPIDSTCYALRFTLRRPKSRWSDTNKSRALSLLREGRMTPAGLAQLPEDVISQWEQEKGGNLCATSVKK